MKRIAYLLVFLVIQFLQSFNSLKAQFLMDMVDTSKDVGRGLLAIYKKFDHIRISGYMQPQYQLASEKGISSYSGGDFSLKHQQPFHLAKRKNTL